MSTTALALVTDALLIDGILQPGDAVPAAYGAQGLSCLNQILGQWSLMPLTIPVTAREVFPLTAGRGGPSDPYTIGPGGDFDTSRPASITSVGLLVTNVAQPYEIMRTIYTTDAYASIVQKELTSSYFTGLYYVPTFATGLGSIQVWPVPSADGTSVVLYRLVQLTEFSTLSTAVDLPPGAQPALTYELAKWLAVRFGAPWTESLEQLCNRTLATYQRGNTAMTDLGIDPALSQQAGVYNILSDATTGWGR